MLSCFRAKTMLHAQEWKRGTEAERQTEETKKQRERERKKEERKQRNRVRLREKERERERETGEGRNWERDREKQRKKKKNASQPVLIFLCVHVLCMPVMNIVTLEDQYFLWKPWTLVYLTAPASPTPASKLVSRQVCPCHLIIYV